MNRDDIIKIAKEAWLRRTGCVWTEPKCWSKAELVRFAELIAAAEREACATVVEDMIRYIDGHECAKAIRARGAQGESQDNWQPEPDLA